MRRAAVVLILLLTLTHGCANHVPTYELARMQGDVVKGTEGATRAAGPGSRLVTPPPGRALRHPRLTHILIDPGHGGHDLGASYDGVHEKTVNLDVARALADELRRQGFRVVMTRETDRFLTLEQRWQTANMLTPDLVVSVHANAAANRSAHGIEVFYLAETFTHDSRRFDDASRAAELNASRESAGANWPQTVTPPVVTPELLERHRQESRELAAHIERSMVARLGVPSRGVKPAGFAMLKWTSSPAVLVEVGFLSNTVECRRLADPGYRRLVAYAVTHGILSYRQWYERVH